MLVAVIYTVSCLELLQGFVGQAGCITVLQTGSTHCLCVVVLLYNAAAMYIHKLHLYSSMTDGTRLVILYKVV